MAVTIKDLSPNEYDRLLSVPYGQGGLPAEDVLVKIAEDDKGEIVGVWTAGPVVFLEGLWIREDYRKTTVLGRMFASMKSTLKDIGIPSVFTLSQSDEITQLAQHGGFNEVPAKLLMLQVKDQVN